MRKTMACAAALTMVGFVVQAEEAKGQLEVIQIQVGQHGIVDPNKTEIPIPDFPWGDQFVVEVLWDEHAEGLADEVTEH